MMDNQPQVYQNPIETPGIPPTPPHDQEYPQPKRSNIPLIIGGILIIVLILVGVYLLLPIVGIENVFPQPSPEKNQEVITQESQIAPSPESEASDSATPSPTPYESTYFDFYDNSVWLNPDLDWNQASANDIKLSENSLFIQSPNTQFTSIPIQGTEWVSYAPMNSSRYRMDPGDHFERWSLLKWQGKIEFEGYTFSTDLIDGPNDTRYGHIRARDGLVQVYQEARFFTEATESGTPKLEEKRIFLSDPVDMNQLIQKYSQ